MNKKLKHLTNTLAGRGVQVSLSRTLFLGLMFTAISGLVGCTNPMVAMNNAIANAVGDKRVQGRSAKTIKGQIYSCNVRKKTPAPMYHWPPTLRVLFLMRPQEFSVKTGLVH